MHLDDVNLVRGAGTDAGIRVGAPWAIDMPLRDLADGYKSTFLWVSDFLGWALDAAAKRARLSRRLQALSSLTSLSSTCIRNGSGTSLSDYERRSQGFSSSPPRIPR